MSALIRCFWMVGVGLILTCGSLAIAQDTNQKKDEVAGQALLDEATDLKIEAKTPDDLNKVIELAEKAIMTGIDAENTKIAKQLIASCAFQRAQSAIEQMMQARSRNQATVTRLRTAVIRDLRKAIDADPKMIDAYVLLARVEEPAKARALLDKSIELLKGDTDKLAKVYMLRGALTEDAEERIGMFKKALDLDPSNVESRQAMITIQIGAEKFEEAIKEAKLLLDQDPKSVFAIKASVAAMKELDKLEDAIELLSKKIDVVDEPVVLLQDRADLYMSKHDQADAESKKEEATKFLDKAIADLSKVIDTDSRNGQALMARCRAYLEKKDYDKAEQDVEDVLNLAPNQPGALYFRSLIAVNQKKMSEAIADLQQVVRLVPNNVDFLLQLGSYYQMDERPKKAIQVADEIIKSENEEWQRVKTRALRLRGDARLSIGEHVGAIADFEKAISLLTDSKEDKDEKSGLLNNLAWVLSTSPNDEIRNGKRAVELGIKACELTDYKASHILSTLAAGYAEVGNFEEAIKWSEKSVEEGKNEGSEQLKQLQEELESYKQKKPWREKQEVKDKKIPVPSPDGVDT